MSAPSGWLWTGTSAVPGWNPPAGVSISAPSFGGTGNNTTGWSEVQYVITISSQSQYTSGNIQIPFTVDQVGALTVLNQVAQTYIYSTNSNWSYDAAQQTKTGTIGDSVALDTITLTADPGKYFNDTITPTVPYAFYGSGNQRSDFIVSSHSYGAYNGSGQATELTLNITDTDFADENEVPGGLPSSTATTLTFGATTYSMEPVLSPNGTSGQLFNDSSSVVSQTYQVTNQTGSTIYVAAWIQNFTNNVSFPQNSAIEVTWNGNSKNIIGDENTTINGITALTTINHLGSVSSLMEVDNLSGDSSWFAKLIWTSNPSPTQNPWDSGQTQWNSFL